MTIKYLPNGAADYDRRPVTIQSAVSEVDIILPTITDERLHALDSFKINSIDPTKPITRRVVAGRALKGLGILWNSTEDYIEDRYMVASSLYDQ